MNIKLSVSTSVCEVEVCGCETRCPGVDTQYPVTLVMSLLTIFEPQCSHLQHCPTRQYVRYILYMLGMLDLPCCFSRLPRLPEMHQLPFCLKEITAYTYKVGNPLHCRTEGAFGINSVAITILPSCTGILTCVSKFHFLLSWFGCECPPKAHM